ncbi:hypothetical protein PFISCL1PPCAC_8783, partial [Pristionchus fissidentatus]
QRLSRARNPRRAMAPYATAHEGVSCDGCMMPNFSGNRYKCLRCWDFDLCHACFVADRFQQDPAGDQVHDREHPMQRILTHHDFEMFYADDDARNYATCRIAVFTCPYCGTHGFSEATFYEHVTRHHPDPPDYQVNCPLCIGLVEADSTNRVVDNLKQHWTSVHYQFDPTLMHAALAAGDATAARLAAAPPHIRAARGDAGLAPLTGALDLPPTRNGARRPMMARRAGRQTGADRTDRENREMNRGERQAAAAAFGMPWTEGEDVQDLFRAYRLVQRNAALPGNEGAVARAPGAERGRVQRLRNPGAATGNMVTNADFIQRMLGGVGDPNATAASYASLVRNVNRDGAGDAGEYAAPRGIRSRTPPAQVVVAMGIRPMQARHSDNARLGDIELDRSSDDSPPVSSSDSEDGDGDDNDVTGGNSDVDAEKGSEVGALSSADEAEAAASAAAADAAAAASDGEEEEKEEERPREEVTSEDERIDALTKEEAIADTTLTLEEVVDMRRCEDPFAVRVIDPMKALRANATNREWKEIKRMLKNNDLRAKNGRPWTSLNEDSRWNAKMDEEGGDSDDEIVTENLRIGGRQQPAAAAAAAANADEVDYSANWLTMRMDTSNLAFARDSYWKDKRFIRPRKMERQQSTATVDQGDLLRNALKSLSIVRCLAGGKVLEDTAGMSVGEEIRKTLELWDMTKTERVDARSDKEVKVEEILEDASRNLNSDYDSAFLGTYDSEIKDVEKELARRRAEGSPSTSLAGKHVEQLEKYLASLKHANAMALAHLSQADQTYPIVPGPGPGPGSAPGPEPAPAPEPDPDQPGPSHAPW